MATLVMMYGRRPDDVIRRGRLLAALTAVTAGVLTFGKDVLLWFLS